MPGTPQHSIVFWAPPVNAEATIVVGDVLIPDDDGSGDWVLSTTANRGTRGSEGVALQVRGGSGMGAVEIQQAGTLDAITSGLATGSKQLVRTSSVGRIERIASYTSGDDIIGYAEADGRVHLHFGLPWGEILALAIGAPTDASYVTLGTNATLTNERVLTGSPNISVTDAGAGGAVTLAVTGSIPVANGGTGLSAAGASGNVLTSNGTDWASSAPAASGEANTSSNSGTGPITWALTKSVLDLPFNTANVALPMGAILSANVWTFNVGGLSTLGTAAQAMRMNAGATALEWYTPSSGGEVNTASSAGGTVSLVLTKSGVNLPFRGISATTPVLATSNATDCTLSLTGGVNGQFMIWSSGSATWGNAAAYITLGSASTATGAVRLPNNLGIYGQNAGATADLSMMYIDASANCQLWVNSGSAGNFVVNIHSGSNIDLGGRVVLSSAQISTALPVSGYAAGAVPYREKVAAVSCTAGVGSTTALSPAEYECPQIEITTTADSQIVTAPNNAGAIYTLIVGGSGANVVFKVSAQTGVTIVSGRTAIVRCNGTDYKRVTSDAIT